MTTGRGIAERDAELVGNAGYAELLDEIRGELQRSRIKAARAVNAEMIGLYWRIGKRILERQEAEGWGAKVIEQLARDLKGEGHKGFSKRNLQYMATFARVWPEGFAQTASAQITWSHHLVLLDKLDTPEDRLWYAERAVAQGWSLKALRHQIASQLHRRKGMATTNFTGTMPTRDSEKFMLELGSELAFAGRQKPLEIDGDEFFLDLLFFHVDLLRYVVIELKVGKFKAEFAGKLNLYLNAIDDQIRRPHHKETIGILLCTERNRQVVEYSLRRIDSPIGVSTYRVDHAELTDDLPPELEGQLPSVSQITTGLQRIVDERAKEVEAVLSDEAEADEESALPA